MSTILWRGDAPAVAQVNTLTVGGTPANGQVYAVTINGKSASYTANGTDTNTSIATALQSLLAASTIPEFQEMTWANPSAGVITATANTPGVPFTNTSSATGTGTLTTAATTASSGPNDAAVAANYSTGVLPANGDDLYLQNSTSSLLYNLSALSGVTLNSYNQDSTFTGTVGLPRNNVSGYIEYRPQYLQIGAGTVNIGGGTGSGSGRTKLDLGTVQAAVNVYSTGSPLDTGLPAVILKGTNVNNVLNCLQGQVGVAIEAGNVSTLATVNVGYQNSQQTDVSLALGPGVTLTTINQNGGTINLNSNVTTHTLYGGTLNVYGSAAITTLTLEEGTCNHESNGTIGTLTVGLSGTFDCSRDPRPRTVTNATVYGTLNDPNKVVTYTNPVSFPNGIGGSGAASLNWGVNFHLQRS